MPTTTTQRLLGVAAVAAIGVLAAGWYRSAAEHELESQQTAQRLAALEQAKQQATPTMPLGTFGPIERAAYAARAQGNLNAGKAGLRAVKLPSQAELKRNQARMQAELESRFAADGSDPRWAQEVETAATTAVTEPTLAPFSPPAGSDMRCARTMCRMEFTFASEGAAADWAAFYPLGMTGELPVTQSQTIRLPGGGVKLVIYGYRSRQATPVR